MKFIGSVFWMSFHCDNSVFHPYRSPRPEPPGPLWTQAGPVPRGPIHPATERHHSTRTATRLVNTWIKCRRSRPQCVSIEVISKEQFVCSIASSSIDDSKPIAFTFDEPVHSHVYSTWRALTYYETHLNCRKTEPNTLFLMNIMKHSEAFHDTYILTFTLSAIVLLEVLLTLCYFFQREPSGWQTSTSSCASVRVSGVSTDAPFRSSSPSSTSKYPSHDDIE